MILIGIYVVVVSLYVFIAGGSDTQDGINPLTLEGSTRDIRYSNIYVFKSEFSEDKAERSCTNVDLIYKKQIVTVKSTYYVCVDDSGTGRKKRAATTRNVAKETSLKSQPGVVDARQEKYVQLSKNIHTRWKRAVSISDAQWTSMWHLQPSQSPSMHVYEAWEMGYTGQGITVAVVDSGIDVDHSDLVDNYRSDLSYDHLSDDSDPSHSVGDDGHGTSCAGIVAAVKNAACGIGVAYKAEVAAQRLLDETEEGTSSSTASAVSHMLASFDIYSNSWSFVTEGKTYSELDETVEDAINTGISQGRGGKGTLYTFAAGNYDQEGDDVNAQRILSSIYTITIGSVSPDGSPAYYTTPGACVLASTYGGDLSDNSIGIITSNRDDGCTTTFQGTSAACPVASGIIALTLQAKYLVHSSISYVSSADVDAKVDLELYLTQLFIELHPDLTWRDIQHLIVETSSTNGLTDGSIKTNGARYKVSNYFGFGLMDAEQMVTKALTWPLVGDRKYCNSEYIYTEVSTTYSDIWDGYRVSDCNINKLEHLELRVRMDAEDYGKIAIYLTSPSGTRSELMRHRPNCNISGDYYWDYMSVQFWGESAKGTWAIHLKDSSSTSKDLVYWRMLMYGTSSALSVFGSNVLLVIMGITVWELVE